MALWCTTESRGVMIVSRTPRKVNIFIERGCENAASISFSSMPSRAMLRQRSDCRIAESIMRSACSLVFPTNMLLVARICASIFFCTSIICLATACSA